MDTGFRTLRLSLPITDTRRVRQHIRQRISHNVTRLRNNPHRPLHPFSFRITTRLQLKWQLASRQNQRLQLCIRNQQHKEQLLTTHRLHRHCHVTRTMYGQHNTPRHPITVNLGKFIRRETITMGRVGRNTQPTNTNSIEQGAILNSDDSCQHRQHSDSSRSGPINQQLPVSLLFRISVLAGRQPPSLYQFTYPLAIAGDNIEHHFDPALLFSRSNNTDRTSSKGDQNMVNGHVFSINQIERNSHANRDRIQKFSPYIAKGTSFLGDDRLMNTR